VRALLPTDRRWNEEEEIALTLPRQHLHWFDVQSGDALVRRQKELIHN
jgi:multiple sugar transport system ATP-binding protein